MNTTTTLPACQDATRFHTPIPKPHTHLARSSIHAVNLDSSNCSPSTHNAQHLMTVADRHACTKPQRNKRPDLQTCTETQHCLPAAAQTSPPTPTPHMLIHSVNLDSRCCWCCRSNTQDPQQFVRAAVAVDCTHVSCPTAHSSTLAAGAAAANSPRQPTAAHADQPWHSSSNGGGHAVS